MAGLAENSVRTPWGVVQTDSRFPQVWEANQACVLETDPWLTIDQIRTDLHPALGDARASWEHIEFWDTAVESPALREARASGDRPDPEVAMMLEDAAPRVEVGAMPVEEVLNPDPGFWPWYRKSLGEFRTPLSDAVLDQMVDRIRLVLLPAGIRWFVGKVNGSMAGYASVITLDRVAYLDQVVTMPELRGRGVATACVTRAMEASLRAENRGVFLLTEEGGRAQRLYERLGFRTRARIETFTRRLGGTGATR